jgi:putative ABC transport system ATP-binding protein
MLTLQNIEVIFHPGEALAKPVLKGVELTIQPGEFITLIGGNGAGKSTLMNVLSGNILANKGQIYLESRDITAWSPIKRAPFIARIFQDPLQGTFSDLTIEENMALAAKRGGQRGFKSSLNTSLRKHFKNALSQLNLDLESRMQSKVATLSGGQRQALSLIMATLCGAKILLLDEHTAALDPKMAKLIMALTIKLIQEHGLSALMITHCMQQALTYGERTLLMQQGKITKSYQGEARLALSPLDLLLLFEG